MAGTYATGGNVPCQHKWTWAEPLGLPGQHVWFCERCGVRKPTPTPEERSAFKRSELDAARALFAADDTTDWDQAARLLGIPFGWKMRPNAHDGYWTLTATAPKRPDMRSLPCGHRSAQVTATTLPLAVARMAQRIRFHQRDC